MKNRSVFYSVILTLFFLSGFNSLVIQVISIYALGIILGLTVYSMSIVVTVFMLGLALGSWLAERIISSRPVFSRSWNILLYGSMVLLSGSYGLLVLPLIITKASLFLSLTTASKVFWKLLFNHFLIASALLLIPTLLMGLTFPFLAISMQHRKDNSRLYMINTAGAAIGSLATGFFLIKDLGVTKSLEAVFLISSMVFLICLILTFRGPEKQNPDIPEEEEPSSRGPEDRLPVKHLFLLAFLSGFIFLSYEMLWNRIFFLILGNRIFISSITLFFVLTGISLGSLVVKPLSLRFSVKGLITFSYSLALTVITSAMISFPYVFNRITYTSPPIGILLFLLMLSIIPSFLLGLIFPFILSILPKEITSRTQNKVKYVGSLYAVNTLASILGSLLVTYLFIRILGTFQTFVLIGFFIFLPVFFINQHGLFSKKMIFPLSAFILNLVFLVTLLCLPLPQGILVNQEDEYGQFRILQFTPGRFEVYNDCTRLVFICGHPVTQYVQEMQAHLPMLFSLHPKKVLNIGTGYGITAGAFTLYKELERIDTVEIIPLMIRYASVFSNYNYRYYRNERIRIHVTDGRQFLSKTSLRYDVISINGTNPYLSGTSSLFSDEFYSLVKKHLNPGGVVCQHIFGFDNASLVHQFRSYFPYVRIILSYLNGVNIIGSDKPLPARPLVRQVDLSHIKIKGREDINESLREGERILNQYLKERPVFRQTDMKPVLEYRTIPGKLDFLFSNI